MICPNPAVLDVQLKAALNQLGDRLASFEILFCGFIPMEDQRVVQAAPQASGAAALVNLSPHYSLTVIWEDGASPDQAEAPTLKVAQ